MQLEVHGVKGFQNKSLFFLCVLAAINIVYVLFYPYFWGSLPSEIMYPIAEQIPAISCPLEFAYNYSGDDLELVKLKTGYVYNTYGFSAVYYSVLAPVYLLWLLFSSRKILKQNSDFQLPRGYKKNQSIQTGLLIALGCAGAAILALWRINYIGDCDVVIDAIRYKSSLGAVRYTLSLWASLFFIFFATFIVVHLILISKQGVKK